MAGGEALADLDAHLEDETGQDAAAATVS
jgi:hypothetical protein